jgi:hypothetical protein
MPRAIWTRAHESAQQDKGPTIGIIGNEHTSVATQQRPCTERARHLFSADRYVDSWRGGSWQYKGAQKVPPTMSAIDDAIRWAAQLMAEIDWRWPAKVTSARLL